MFHDCNKGATCDECGHTLRRDFPRIPACGRCRKPQPKCQHLGDPIGDPLKVLCDTCKGRVHIKYPVHQCALLGRCLPTYRPKCEALENWTQRKPESDLYHLCDGCEHLDTATPIIPRPSDG